MPNGDRDYPLPVWVLTTEDEPNEQLNLMLYSAGAKAHRVRVGDAIDVGEGAFGGRITTRCILPRYLEALGAELQSSFYGTLIIDRLADFLDDKFLPTSYQDVCTGLARLALLAWQFKVVVLILRCPESMFPAPRRGWGAGDIPRRTVPRIRWVGNHRYTEYERIIAGSGFGWYERERLDIWLRNELSAGPVPMKELEWLAADEGWTPKQLRSAKQRLGVLAHRHGFGAEGYSMWSLPWR